jgi:methylmalonyl-CoA/ethylmalonyl-CoA epimerase
MSAPTESLRGPLVGPIDHLGIAVKDLEAAKRFYGEVLDFPLIFEEEVATESVRVAAYDAGGVRVELLETTDPDGPIGRHIERRGTGIHHVCYAVPDIHRTLGKLKEKGLEPILPAPRPGAHGCLIAFLHPKVTGGVLIELSQPPFGGLAHGWKDDDDGE